MQINPTREELEDTFREAVLRILDLPEDDAKTVRFPYGSTYASGSAPDFGREDNVCFIYLMPAGDGYEQQTHISYRDDGTEKLTQIDEHTDIYRLNCMCYGPKCETWAKDIKSGFVKQKCREFFGKRHLHLVSQSFTISTIPELKDGEWWRRCDAAALFYQFVHLEEENSVGTIEKVRITHGTERR